jgi:hypothetical protein
MSDNVVRLQRLMWEALQRDPDANFDDTVTALVDLITFHMTMVCEDCRKSMVEALIERAPDMLVKANDWAAQIEAAHPNRRTICDTRTTTARH